MMKKLFFFLALLLPIGAWAGETVIATDHWAGPYFFSDDGVGATCNMTSEGLAIYNPKVQELLWTPQAMVIADMTLEENHTYKVIVSAKIPSAGKLQVNLRNWESDWSKSISVNASSNFQDFEFLFENCPYYTESGHVMFQNGGIKGTSIVRNVKVLDMTNSGKVIAEKSWDAPYWFDDEGTGATWTITDEGLGITNPKVQEDVWKPQTWVLKYAKLEQAHTYKVVVNAKIPSDGILQVQLGTWESGNEAYCTKRLPVTASSDFQDYEFVYEFNQISTEEGYVLFQNGGIKGTCVVRSISIIDMKNDIVGDDYWAGSQMFIDDGVDGATCNMTSNGLAIYNPQVQEVLWNPQAMQINNMKLEENHSYKVIVSAKIPSAGKLQLNLSNWYNNWGKNISVNASNDFQDLEFLFENCPYTTQYGYLMFQNGGIKGTSIVRNVKVLDITNGEVVVAEKNWDGPYWFGDEGTAATFTMTDEGLAITNPKVQENLWMPQTMVLKDAKLQKNHSYSVIVEAKIPSKGDLQVQLGSWDKNECWDQSIPVLASSDFQTFAFTYEDFPVDAVDGHVLFQSGGIAGTCVVRRISILDLGDDPVDLAYNYNTDNTAEVIKNDKKYKGDVIIPATVSHNGKDYTVTSINEDAFADCTNLRSITIPATVTELNGWGFRNCASLEQITVASSNPRFNSSNNCNAIIETGKNKLIVGSLKTVIPNDITRIGADAFWGRWGLNTINIPNSVKEIGSHAFSWCFLTDITLPSVLEVIEEGAFESTDLQSVTLPASLKTIGEKAFNDCPQLTKVTVQNSVPLELNGGETFSNRANATLYVPAGSKKAYKAASIWKEFKGIVEAEHNSVYSYDLTAYLGVSTEMEINLENWDPFTAYQFDIVLPEGITLEKYTGGNSIKFTRGKRNTSNHNISVTDRGNNTYRVIGVSTKNNVISGNDGALLTVYLIANENMGKKTCQAEIKNVIMTTPEEKQVNFDPTTVTITTKTLLLGDSNDDNNVNVTDLVATVNYILGRPSDKFNKTAADITKNHVVNINDVISGLDLIKNATRGARMRTRTAEASNDKMTISDLSISAGMTKQLQVELTNEGTYVGFQFDLVLPEGIKMTSYSTTARIPEGTTVDDNETEGAYRFVGYTGGTPISGNSGSILNITVKADENLKGRHLTGYLRNVNLGTGNDEGPTIEETPFKITDETSGDLNKNGKLDAADVKAIVELIMKGEYKAKADVNGDSKVNAADIVVVTDEIK